MVEGTLACLEHAGRASARPSTSATRARRSRSTTSPSGSSGSTGADVDITFQPLHYADVELRIPNVEKAREVLGFEAKVDLDEGLEKTIAWYREKALSRVRLAFPELGEEELAEVRAVFESGALTMGPKVEEFEQLVAAACGVEHAVAVSNGTAALHLAVLALGIGEGDEVIVPAYTFPATANVVRLAGATPVLVDVDPATFNLDVGKVYDAVTPRTKAVLAVHLFGRPLDWEALQNAVPPEVLLLEDAAGALGAKLARDALRRARDDGLPLVPPAQDRHDRRGRRGDDERRGARRVGATAAQPRARRRTRTSVQPSTNYRLADILCAIGIPQLRRLDELLAERTRIADGYTERLRDARRRPGRRRGRHARLAGLRDPARPQGRGTGDAARARGSRCRSARTPCSGCPPTATRGRFPAPTQRSTGRSRCRSTRA